MCNCYSCSNIGSSGDCNRCIYNGSDYLCIGCDINSGNKYLLWNGSDCDSFRIFLIF